MRALRAAGLGLLAIALVAFVAAVTTGSSERQGTSVCEGLDPLCGFDLPLEGLVFFFLVAVVAGVLGTALLVLDALRSPRQGR